jgi:hypothetical protein
MIVSEPAATTFHNPIVSRIGLHDIQLLVWRDQLRERADFVLVFLNVLGRQAELRGHYSSGLVQDVVRDCELDSAGPCEFDELEWLAAAEERANQNVRVCSDPVHLRCSARCSRTASTAIWMAPSSDVASAISRL